MNEKERGKQNEYNDDVNNDGTGKDQLHNEESLPEPQHKGKSRSWLIWLVPLLAIGLAAFLVWKSLPAEGIDIQIHAQKGSGIEPQSTLIKYRGVRVGIVNKVSLNDSGRRVIIEATLENDYRKFASKNSRFWVVRPEISLSGISGLDTIVSGPYITLRPGDGPQKKIFEALTSPPAIKPAGEGLFMELVTERLGLLKKGTPVSYRGITVGQIYDYHLAATATEARLLVYIEKPYKNLVRKNTVFWKSGGLDLNISLFGGKVSSESIQGILTGGIALATPDPPAEQVEDYAVFSLAEEQKDEWLKWSPQIELPIEE